MSKYEIESQKPYFCAACVKGYVRSDFWNLHVQNCHGEFDPKIHIENKKEKKSNEKKKNELVKYRVSKQYDSDSDNDNDYDWIETNRNLKKTNTSKLLEQYEDQLKQILDELKEFKVNSNHRDLFYSCIIIFL
jgi:hypothetical protein